MRFILIAWLLTMTSVSVMAQIQGEDEVYLSGDRIEAKFNGGGLDKFSEFIRKELDNSKMIKAGKLVFSFTVSETGELKNIKVIEFPDIIMATEIIRVLKKSPKWQPAVRGGKPISIDIKFPMTFSERQPKK